LYRVGQKKIGPLQGGLASVQPKELVADEQRFRLLVEGISDYAIYMLDPTGVVTTWNAGAQRFKGYTTQEILGEHFSRFYTEEDRNSGLPARALRTAEQEGRFEQEGWRVRKDGSLMWAHVVMDPIREPSGKLVGFAKITRDITERKKAQEALRLSEERFRLLVQGVTDYAIYMLDPDGRVTNWNTGAQRFKGYIEQEIIGEHFSRFYTDEDRASGLPIRGLETAAQEGRFENEGWRVRKDGTRFWAHVIIDAIRNDQGELIGFAKVTRDITERKKAQEALESTRAALFQSQKMEAVGTLVGGIAHDFNNLLAVLIGNLELLRKRGSDDPRVLRLLDNSMQAAQRGASLTQRMLAFARRQDLRVEAVEVRQLVHGMSDLLQRSIGPGVQIETRFPMRLDPALVDANQLELALLNLVLNARDAMPEGGTIIISARIGAAEADAQRPAEEFICLAVVDTGEGMDQETLARAVEPFFTTKGVGKGTGLGLSMVHGLAQQSGGRLVLKSRKGEGTTAELWLPVAEVESAAARRPEAALQPVRSLRVLVVDDDALVLANTAAMLEDLGHEVIEASSGEQALRVLRRSKAVDLVITDQIMPSMTGSQLVEAVRSEWPNLKVILATGYAELPPNAEELPRLNKPFLQQDLARMMAALIAPEENERVVKFRPKQS
jgi:PAS domain S-box-containing protein